MVFDKAIAKRFFQVIFALLLAAAIFFYAAGTLDIPRGWLYFGIYFAYLIVNMFVFLKWNPEVIRARSEIKLTKSWDVAFGIVFTLLLLITPAVAGLDIGRFHWSELGIEYAIAGIILFVPGAALITWSMAVNKFFEGSVRIQKDRGQKVITSGPYAFVRHPGYVGMILIYFAPGLIIGSGAALIPSALIAIAFIVRTYFEDRTLCEELDGYKEYTEKTKYRLVPGIW